MSESKLPNSDLQPLDVRDAHWLRTIAESADDATQDFSPALDNIALNYEDKANLKRIADLLEALLEAAEQPEDAMPPNPPGIGGVNAAYFIKRLDDARFAKCDVYEVKTLVFTLREVEVLKAILRRTEQANSRTETLEDLRGIAPDATGGMSSEDFIAKQRSEQWDGR